MTLGRKSAAEIRRRQLPNRVHDPERVSEGGGGKGEQRLDPDTLVRHDLGGPARENRSPARPKEPAIELSMASSGMTFVLALPWGRSA